MPTVSVNASREGYIWNGNSSIPVWPDARYDPNGSAAFNYSTPTPTQYGVQVGYAAGRAGDFYWVTRSYFYWNLSAYAGNITAIDMNIDMAGSGTPLLIQPAQSVLAFGGNGGSPLSVGEFDINQPTPPTPPAYGPPFANTTGVVTTTLDPAAVIDANNNGFLIIQLVENDYDYVDVDPTPGGYAVYEAAINFATGNNTLDVTYTSPGYANQVNNVAGASIDEVIGVAKGSIGEIMNT
jgi:hypothetical protein